MGDYFDLVADRFGLPRAAAPRARRGRRAAVADADELPRRVAPARQHARMKRELRLVLRHPTVAEGSRAARSARRVTIDRAVERLQETRMTAARPTARSLARPALRLACASRVAGAALPAPRGQSARPRLAGQADPPGLAVQPRRRDRRAQPHHRREALAAPRPAGLRRRDPGRQHDQGRRRRRQGARPTATPS